MNTTMWIALGATAGVVLILVRSRLREDDGKT